MHHYFYPDFIRYLYAELQTPEAWIFERHVLACASCWRALVETMRSNIT